MVATVCYRCLRAQVLSQGQTPLLWNGLFNDSCLFDHGAGVEGSPCTGDFCPWTTLDSVHPGIIEDRQIFVIVRLVVDTCFQEVLAV